MSKSINLVLALVLVSGVAACAKKSEEVVFVDSAPVSVEPTYTGKYK
jgi:uncharacterized lipoprotein YehR (DUF1307 family)